jgi:methenyltetrahydrofolate cyclohydrolase
MVERKPGTVTQTDIEVPHGSPLIEQPLRDVVRQVADPSRESGGGVVVGITLAGAAASAELVLRLAVKRKSLTHRRNEIAELLDRVAAARRSFEDAADQDIAAFEHLVATQRAIKQLPETEQTASREQLSNAYVQAADVPLGLARQALEFMRDVERGLEFATRFIASDIGAAAALARGAIDAALLTVDANLAYVDDGTAATRRAEMSAIRGEAAEIAERVLQAATTAINGRTDRS